MLRSSGYRQRARGQFQVRPRFLAMFRPSALYSFPLETQIMHCNPNAMPYTFVAIVSEPYVNPFPMVSKLHFL